MDESDIEQVRQWRNSKEVSEHMISQEFISQEEQINWFNEVKISKTQFYFIIQSKKKKKLGVVNFSNIDIKNNSAEPGLYIGEKSDRNSLFGMEAYYLILKYGFEELKLDKVYGTVLSSNSTAMKMNKSFGYKVDEILRDSILINGISQNLIKLFLLKNDFYTSQMVSFFCRSTP
jgi:UDP-4-amino-4,6-dideoxy-N-acetyl-beta-L-altrosamine N-acetyltransferase